MKMQDIGLFWKDTPEERAACKKSHRSWGPMPPIPRSSWRSPTEFPNLSAAKVIGVDTETWDPELLDAGPGWARGKGHIIGASLAVADGTSWYFPMRHGIVDGKQVLPPEEAAHNMDPQAVLRFLDHTLHDNRPKVGANLIYDVGWLNWEGVRIGGQLMDIQFAEPLLNSEEPDVSLEGLASRYLGAGKVTSELYEWLSHWNKGKANDRQRANLYLSPPSLAGPYAEADASLPIRILEKQWGAMAQRGVLDLFSLECRLIPLLVAMRMKGAPVNVPKAQQAHDELGVRMAAVEQRMRDLAGREVRAGAPESVAEAFKALGIPLPTTKDKKTGEIKFSTKANLLEAIDHPLAEAILEHRQLHKVRGTFLEAYIIDKNVNGRIHCSFNPLKSDGKGTRSGRFSCVEENTLILTLRGEVKIKHLKVGDKVWTHKKRWRKVLATYIKPEDDMYEVTFTSGHRITCTAGHRILTLNGWKRLDELTNCGPDQIQFFTPLAEEQSRASAIHFGALSFQGDADCGHGGDGTVDSSRRSACEVPVNSILFPSADFSGRVQGAEASSVQLQQDERKEPDARYRGRTSSQLEGGCLRRGRRGTDEDRPVRIHRNESCSDVRQNGDSSPKPVQIVGYGGSPHQRKQIEQRSGQSCAMHSERSRYDSRDATGQRLVEIKEINYKGRFAVYDMAVEDDESYYACGIFNHNSSDPNLQNIPTRTEEGKIVRQAFVAGPGKRWRSFDYSSIEYRLLAHFAVGDGADAVRAIYAQDATADYHKIVGDMIKRLTGLDLPRGKVKTINFGIIYGMALNALATALKLTKPEAAKLMDDYHIAAPYARATMDMCAREVHQTGMVTTLLGRKSDFNRWGSKKWTDEGRIDLPYAEACRKWGPYNIERSHTHKALNRKLQGSAADIMKKAMVDAYEAGLFADSACGIPILTVHDELDFEDEGDVDNPAWAELKHVMEHCTDHLLRVPLLVEGGHGPSWADAH